MRFIRCCEHRQYSQQLLGRGRAGGACDPQAGEGAGQGGMGGGGGRWKLLTVVKPAILFRSRFDWMIATSSHTRLLVSKSSVSRL